ncbi:hypothetical protein JGH11_03830 [Dysgonomonas sp. Marseille-P4677]|uniref:hypothetical protein n=1 Tax=Dysgonomonas sp. Marseille-P4677 TaxID=2364790 RepID=UPI001913BA3C|nr:hypothetical protein [Dysgonomonas sp. Marseille-P4677]MBK5719995.1 hypothetical protein [Dysgonomonas sp. Marseille-P4677]
MLFKAIVEEAKPEDGFERYAKLFKRLLNLAPNKKESAIEEYKRILNDIREDEIGIVWLESGSNDYPNEFIYWSFYPMWKEEEDRLKELRKEWLLKMQTFNFIYHKYLLVIAANEKLNNIKYKFKPKSNIDDRRLEYIYKFLITEQKIETTLDNWLYWFGRGFVSNPQQMEWHGAMGACAWVIQQICGTNDNKVLKEAFGFEAKPHGGKLDEKIKKE